MLKTLETSAKAPTRFGFRRAFTLVELMVVIAIIGFLAAITTGVVVKVISSQRRASTQLLIDTINNALATQLSKIVEKTKREMGTEDDSTTLTEITTRINNTFTITLTTAAQQSNYKSLIDNLNLGGAYTANVFTNYALPSGAKVGGPGKNDPSITDFEKAFCLYLILKANIYSPLDPETLGKTTIQYAKGPQNQMVPFIADQWGDPIKFIPAQSQNKPPTATSPNL